MNGERRELTLSFGSNDPYLDFAQLGLAIPEAGPVRSKNSNEDFVS